uniref:Uncharacterized protein n=1 Tax=Romanomermis culicivorax TaxID=13658 RepID=A0A915IT54_ROMCU
KQLFQEATVFNCVSNSLYDLNNVVLNYRYDNGSFEKYSKRIPNKWFRIGELFNLNVIPSLVDRIKFLVNYVLPNGTLDEIGQMKIQSIL